MNIRLYPWFKFFQSLLFWQAVWFLFFQERLSAAEAILIYALYDIATTALEVPSGYLSDRVGRRITLILASVAVVVSAGMQAVGGAFWVYALAQVALGAGMAFASGTDSSLLYESLAREGRSDEVEAHEMRAWRAQFAALALSALTGGALAAWDPVWPFWATAAASCGAVAIALGFVEPPRAERARAGLRGLGRALAHPVLAWLFVLAVALYIFSHVPFVFGQPFILETLEARGMAAEAPLVSGGVTTAMMVISVATSWAAPGIRRAIGLGPILLVALALQVALIGALAASAHVAVVALLMLRMVPDSLSRPFLLARMQPLLEDAHRATYLSLQSFVGRLVFAGSLAVASLGAPADTALDHAEIQAILVWYLVAGLGVAAGLALCLRRAGV